MADITPSTHLTTWPAVQVMAFMVGRSLEISNDNGPYALCSTPPIYDFLTCGQFPYPRNPVIYNLTVDACRAHIAENYPCLKHLHEQCNRDLLHIAQNQLSHDINASVQDVTVRQKLIQEARATECLEACRAVTNKVPELFHVFDKSCDRIQFEWLQQKGLEFKLTPFIALQPLPPETIASLKERPSKGAALIGSQYSVPEYAQKKPGPAMRKGLSPEHLVKKGVEFFDPNRDIVEDFLHKKKDAKGNEIPMRAPSGWRRN